jgi:hypothetical protein
MSFDGFSGGPGFGGFGGPGFGGQGFGGFGGPGFGGQGFGGPGFGGFGGPGFGGPGAGGFGHGSGHGLKRAAFGTAAVLLDGPADAAQIVQRVSEATEGALTPPEDIAQLAIGLLAARGLVSVDDGVATLTEFGRNLLAWRGVTSETARALFKRAGQFVDVIKIRKELFEVAGRARSIAWTGTDEQKATLAEARTKILQAVTEAKKDLDRALADS